ncbi:hypothetical protein ABZG18_004913 [Citrobacter freundii]
MTVVFYGIEINLIKPAFLRCTVCRLIKHLVCSVTGCPFPLGLYFANLSANADFNHLPEVKLKLCWKAHTFLLSNKKPALGGLSVKPIFLDLLSLPRKSSLRHEYAPGDKSDPHQR